MSWLGVTYANLRPIGSGGSSGVYLALARSGPRRGLLFAIKMFHAVKRLGWRDNFMREVHVLRDCDHPSIMRVFDDGVYLDKHPFVVTEYLPQTLLKAEQNNSVTEKRKLSIVAQLLSALNYLLHRDPPAVHRDIKPSNIFLKEDSCVLGDFGLILQLDGSFARPRHAGPESKVLPEMARHYRTPELVEYHRGGTMPPPASDVFQLGLVAAELFTGHNPLSAGAPHTPVSLQAISDVDGKLGLRIKLLLGQMLTINTSERPTASRMLDQWQDLYLDFCKTERDEERAARMQVSSKTPDAQRP